MWSLRKYQQLARRLVLNERGESPFLTLAAVVLLTVVTLAVSASTFAFVRTGTWVMDLLNRGAQLNISATAFQNELNNLTDIKISDNQSLIVYDQPSKRTAYYNYPASGVAQTVCVTNAWAFVPSTTAVDLLDLAHTTTTYTGDSCTSSVASTRTETITGFAPTSQFTFANAAGRDLHYVASQELGVTASTATRPSGLFDNEWKYPYPTIVNIKGSMQNLINTTKVNIDAPTPLKQLRPGSEPWSIAAATAPTIQITQVQGDVWQAAFTPTVPIDDNRAVVTWASQDIVGTGTQTGSISSFTGSPIITRTITQGNRWQIQAAYQITLGGTTVTSATGTADWVRPIDTPAAPSVTAGASSAAITPVSCPTGTTPAYQMRYNIDGRGWTDWSTGNTVTYTLQEGDQVAVQGSQRCFSIYTTSAWSLSGATTYTKPITSTPSLAVTGSISGSIGTTTVTPNGCPSYLKTQVMVYGNVNDGGFNAASSWYAATSGKTTSYFTSDLHEGAAFKAGANARCVSTWAQGPNAWGSDGTQYVRPITTAPWVSAGISLSGGNIIAGRTAEGGCPAGTSYQWNRSDAVNGNWNWWLAGWAWTTTNWVDSGRVVGYGKTGQVAVMDRCVTAYATGPNSAVSYSSTQYRPYPTPGTPGGLSATQLNACDGSQALFRLTFNSVSYASRYDGTARGQMTDGSYTGWQQVNGISNNGGAILVNSAPGRPLRRGYGQVQVRAYGNGGYSGWTSTANAVNAASGCYVN